MGSKDEGMAYSMVRRHTPVQLLEALVGSLPHAGHITDLDIGKDSIRFTWRGNRYNVCSHGLVEYMSGTSGVPDKDEKARLVQIYVDKGLARLERRER